MNESFPKKGVSATEIQNKLAGFEQLSNRHGSKRNYFDEGYHLINSAPLPDLEQKRAQIEDAFHQFHWYQTWSTNKGGRYMEAEVIRMMGEVFGCKNAYGIITYGGSESNTLGLIAAKLHAFVKDNPHIDCNDIEGFNEAWMKYISSRSFSVVMPCHTHFSVLKACMLLGMEPIIVMPRPVPDTFEQIDAADIAKAMRDDTICLVGTAGAWPTGSIDPIKEMGELAVEKGIWLHCDAAYGGYIIPFLESSGYYQRHGVKIEPWDFRVPGVSSITADLHKNGMCPPPTSSWFIRDRKTLELMRALCPPYGALTGSRTTGNMAAAWTAFHTFGVEGYQKIAENNMRVKEAMIAKIEAEIPQVKVNKEGVINILTITSTELDLRSISDSLYEQGWQHMNGVTPDMIPYLVFIIMPQNNDTGLELVDAIKAAIATSGQKIGEYVPSDEIVVYGGLDMKIID